MRVSVVTGGGGGIGRAITAALSGSESAVVVVDRDEGAARDTLAAVEAAGGRGAAVAADVTRSLDVAGYVETARAFTGRIDVLVNSAGVEGVVAPLGDYPEDVFDTVMRVNTKGTFLGLHHVLPAMIETGAGAVVNLGSTSSIRGRANLSAYVASKHAVLGLTRTAAAEVAGTGVRVNAVLPGPVRTRMIDSLDAMAAERPGGAIARAVATRRAEPEEIAATVAFLVSDAAAHVNGAGWVVDGGSTVA